LASLSPRKRRIGVKKLMVYAALLAVVMVAAAPAIAENEPTSLQPPFGKDSDVPSQVTQEPPVEESPPAPPPNVSQEPSVVDNTEPGDSENQGLDIIDDPSNRPSIGPGKGSSEDTNIDPPNTPGDGIVEDVDKDAGGDTPDETVNDTSTNSDAGRDAVKEDDRRAGSDRDATDDRKAGKDDKDDDDNNNEGKGKGNGKGKDDDDEDSVEQSQEQDANSGDANQSADVINTGDNVNQCVGILQVANTGNAQNATGVTQYGSEADKIELEDGSRITLTPQLVVDCRQIILQIVKGERANETKVSNAKLREALQPRSSGAAQAARSGAGVIVPSSRSGVMSVPKVLSASSAGQPKSAAKTLPRTGGSYATLLGLSGGVVLVGGGLLIRRISR